MFLQVLSPQGKHSVISQQAYYKIHCTNTTGKLNNTHKHTITPVFPEGLGRGVPTYTHSSPVCFLGPM